MAGVFIIIIIIIIIISTGFWGLPMSSIYNQLHFAIRILFLILATLFGLQSFTSV